MNDTPDWIAELQDQNGSVPTPSLDETLDAIVIVLEQLARQVAALWQCVLDLETAAQGLSAQLGEFNRKDNG